MSDVTAVKAGPALANEVDEVWGFFRGEPALQEAMARLGQAGFDRAEMSLPDPTLDPAHRTPEQGAANPDTTEDNQQMRTLHASMAGSAGALLAAGVVVATGGAAIPAVAAAAAAGVGAGALAHGAERAADSAQAHEREQAAAEGRLVLAVRINDPSRLEPAVAAMRAAGAADVKEIARAGGTAPMARAV